MDWIPMMTKHRRKGAVYAGEVVNLDDGPGLLQPWTFRVVLLRAFHLLVLLVLSGHAVNSQGRDTTLLFQISRRQEDVMLGKTRRGVS